jgi:uncharacterized protein
MRLIFAFLFLLTAASLARADDPPACMGSNILDALAKSDPKMHAEIIAETKATKNGEAILWKIEPSDPAIAPSYLFGTMHLTDPRVHDLPKETRALIEDASVVALELAEAVDRQKLAVAMMKYAHYLAMPAGKTLWDVVPDADEHFIRESPNIPPGRLGTFDAYQPWVIAAMLSLPLCETARQAAGLISLDEEIGQIAIAAGKPVVGVEKVEEQLKVLGGMAMDDQVRYLIATAKASNQISDYIETMVQLYLRREIAAIMPLTRRSDPSGDNMALLAYVERELIEKRNHTMHDRAIDLLQKGNAFIAVGALHLPGDKGLVELLRQSGYKVTPVN